MSLISLGLYFGLMLAIGFFAFRTSTNDSSDYLLGGRNVSPQVTALSAGASDMSGWMLMGLPGAMFVMGHEAFLIALGLVFGAWANYVFVAPRLRVFTEVNNNSLTIPEFFSERFLRRKSGLRLVSATIIVVFFTLYSAAGLVAGGKLFQAAFSVDYRIGVYITVLVVVCYTLLGGFLAVSLTDFVQGTIMFVALILVPLVATSQFSSFDSVLTSASATMTTVSDSWSQLGVLGTISALAWGLGYFGQPHIIVRFMAIRSVSDIGTARNIGMGWMTVTIIGALSTGFVGVAYVNKFNLQLNDPETIFIVFSQILFHPLVSGFLLAAILAAIMSTISSQLLVSASSLSEDLITNKSDIAGEAKRAVLISRLGVVVVAASAAFIALEDTNSVLSLVSNAWAGFGAAFGPLVLFALFYRELTYKAAVVGMSVGAISVIVCIHVPIMPGGSTINQHIYELIPGFVLSALAIYGVSIFDRTSPKAKQLFRASEKELAKSFTRS